MQNLKEFVIYTKKYLSIGDTYAIMKNAESFGMNRRLIADDSGSAIAENLKRKHRNHNITFVCGTGGNGAIGMAAARHMMDFANVNVALITDSKPITNESNLFNYKILENIIDVTEIGTENIQELKRMLKKTDDIVDAIVGVGLHGRLSSTLLNIIKLINEANKYVISIDVPSGINADTGAKNTGAVNPDLVLAIYKMKNYLSLSTANYSTNLISIGIPISIELLTGPGDVMLATRPRSIYANKYEHGNVLVLGGSTDYKGAPLLSGIAAENALAALKTGSGYVTVMSPKGASGDSNKALPELIVRNTSKEQLSDSDVIDMARTKHDAIVIGPGLSQDYIGYEQLKALLKLERDKNRKIVIDASAIRMLARHKELIGKDMILTPHIGEFKQLSGIDLSKHSMDSKINVAVDFAKNYDCTLVLKGNETIITDGKVLKINKSETPTLGTMGTGDVLSGIIASYIAINKGMVFESAVAGVYVHSTIGDRLYKEVGLHATAYDVAMAIPNVIKEFDRINY